MCHFKLHQLFQCINIFMIYRPGMVLLTVITWAERQEPFESFAFIDEPNGACTSLIINQFLFCISFHIFHTKITNFINRDIITYCKLKIFHICNRQSRYVFKKCNLNDLKKLYDTACNRGYVYPRCQSTCSSFNRPESGLFQANGR